MTSKLAPVLKACCYRWPWQSGRAGAVQSFAKDGYNLLHWAREGFEFSAVYDMTAGDLRALRICK
jgi:hypothetical protein